MNFQQHIVRQFKQPEGSVGHLAGWIMARRPSNRARNSWTIDQLDLQHDHRVLELGYGPGLAIADAARIVTSGCIVGVDHSTVMQAQATARNDEAVREGRVQLLVGSAEAALEVGADFDAIYSVNVVMFWKDPQAVFVNLRELLKPGGILASTYQPRHRNASAEDAGIMAERIVGWMTKAGYEELRVTQLHLRPIPAICVLGRRPSTDQERFDQA